MPRGKIHDSIANRVFGVIPVDLNAEMDKASKAFGSRHRIIGHDDKAIEKIAQQYKDEYPLAKLNQPLSYYLAKLHLTCDFCPAHPTEDSPVTIEGEVTEVSQSDRKLNSLSAELSLRDEKIEYLNEYIVLIEDKCHLLESLKQALDQDFQEIIIDFSLWMNRYGSNFGFNVDAVRTIENVPYRLFFKATFKMLLQKLAQQANQFETLTLLREWYMLVEKPRSLPYKGVEKSDRSTIEPENKKEQT